jgi:DNA polymerase-3 subunit delta'
LNLTVFPWQQRQWLHLTNAHLQGRLPHGILLTSPSGTGMEDFSRAFAAWLMCESQNKNSACKECHACKLLMSGNHPDLHMVEPEEAGKQIKVEAIRALIEFTHLTSQYHQKKIAIIQPADAMNRSSANALLKTLEEPSGDVVLLLVSSSPSRLPVTIRSRCQRIQFHPVDRESGLAWLIENSPLDDARAEELWTLAQGKPLHVLEMLDNDQAEHQAQLLRDLRGLLDKRVDFMLISQKWSEYGAVEVFNALVYLMAVMTRSKLLGGNNNGKSRNNRDLQEIINQLNLQQLVDSYDIARRHYQAATAMYNLNHVGLLEDFLLFWQGQTATGG